MTDEESRQTIPIRESINTLYSPLQDFLMVVPLPTLQKIGSIILPSASEIRLNEGHIVEKGPRCSKDMDVGDCVTWDTNTEYRMKIDNVPFILVRESNIQMRIPKAKLVTSTTEGVEPRKPYIPLIQ